MLRVTPLPPPHFNLLPPPITHLHHKVQTTHTYSHIYECAITWKSSTPHCLKQRGTGLDIKSTVGGWTPIIPPSFSSSIIPLAAHCLQCTPAQAQTQTPPVILSSSHNSETHRAGTWIHTHRNTWICWMHILTHSTRKTAVMIQVSLMLTTEHTHAAGSRFSHMINYSSDEKSLHPKTSHVVQFAVEMFINCLVE